MASSGNIEEIVAAVIDTSIRIHRRLGPGLLESVHESLVAGELRRMGLRVERQKAISFHLDGVRYDNGFTVDLLVEGSLVIELKAAEKSTPVHYRQLLTYLRLLDRQVRVRRKEGPPPVSEGAPRTKARPRFTARR